MAQTEADRDVLKATRRSQRPVPCDPDSLRGEIAPKHMPTNADNPTPTTGFEPDAVFVPASGVFFNAAQSPRPINAQQPTESFGPARRLHSRGDARALKSAFTPTGATRTFSNTRPGDKRMGAKSIGEGLDLKRRHQAA